MTHDQCRLELSSGEPTSSALAHVRACEGCRRFADALLLVTSGAPALAPSPPAGLSDRVVDVVSAELPAPVATLDGGTRRGDRVAGRRQLVLPAAAAVVALALIASSALVSLRSGGGDDVLLAAARTTEAEGTASVRVRGRTTVTVPVPAPARPATRPRKPSFAAVPVELRPTAEAQWAASMEQFERSLRRFERQMATFERQLDQALDDVNQQLENSLRMFEEGFGGTGSPRRRPPPSPPPRPRRSTEPAAGTGPRPTRPRPPAAPAEVAVGFAVDGRGRLGFDTSAVRLSGRVTGSTGSRPFALASAGEISRYRNPDGRWMAVGDAAGPLGTVLLRADAAQRILRSREGELQALGEARLDGQAMQRYRFRVDERGLGRMTDAMRDADVVATAWLDSKGRARRVAVTSSAVLEPGSATRWRSHVVIDLFGFGGGEVEADLPPSDGSLLGGHRVSPLVYPFSSAVRQRTQAPQRRR